MQCELCPGPGSGHVSMEGRGRCGPSAKLRDTGQLALPTAGSERPQGRKARCLSPGLLIQTALSAGRNTRRIPKTGPGKEEGRKAIPQGPPAESALLPSPLFQRGLLTAVCAMRSNSE